MEISNKEEYMTITWTVDHDNGVSYSVTMVENEFLDDWHVIDLNVCDLVAEGTELWRELVAFCQGDLED